MARVTVEDCLKNVSNRFELVLIASKRARQLIREGATPLVAAENDKPTVLALREIADDLISSSSFTESAQTTSATEDISELPAEIIAETQTTIGEEPKASHIIDDPNNINAPELN